MNLTVRQQKILDFIRARIRERGFPPTVREIGEEFGIRSTNGVHGFLRALEKKGAINRDRGLARSIEVLDPDTGELDRPGVLPLAGRIAAGRPIEAIEQQDTLDVPSLFEGSGRFALQVRGDSMIDAGILEGDYVIVEKRNVARNGEIVVALLADGEATLKRFFKDADQVRLVAENPSYAPIVAREVALQGVVVGLVRAPVR
ncbi:MAG: transcriptional repressor LexA [bacterium]